jgi:tetratricopeptide (TPR) repeat protein
LSARAAGLAAFVALGVGSPLSAQQSARKPPLPSIDSLEARARVDSNDAVVHYELAMGYWGAKRYDDADRALHQAVALAPEYAEADLALFALPFARGEKYWKKIEKSEGKDAVVAMFEAANRYYRRAFLVDPMVDLGVLAHIKGVADLGYGLQGLAIPWWLGTFQEGIYRLLDGNYGRAHALLASVLLDRRSGIQYGNLPDGVLWYHALAAAHLQRYDDAVDDLALLTGRAVAKAEEDPIRTVPLEANDYRYTLATVLYLAGRYDQAAPTFRRALEFDIALYPAHVQLARISEARNDWDEAVRERRAAIDASPDDAGLVTDLGATLLRAGKLEEAAEAFTQAMAAAPRDPRVPYLAGIVALRLGRQDEARAALTRFLEVAPSRFAPQIAETREQLRSMETAH